MTQKAGALPASHMRSDAWLPRQRRDEPVF